MATKNYERKLNTYFAASADKDEHLTGSLHSWGDLTAMVLELTILDYKETAKYVTFYEYYGYGEYSDALKKLVESERKKNNR